MWWQSSMQWIGAEFYWFFFFCKPQSFDNCLTPPPQHLLFLVFSFCCTHFKISGCRHCLRYLKVRCMVEEDYQVNFSKWIYFSFIFSLHNFSFVMQDLLLQFRMSDLIVCQAGCSACFILGVPDQNGVSLLYIMLDIHYSGLEPSIRNL